jgi:hypothetical protein
MFTHHLLLPAWKTLFYIPLSRVDPNPNPTFVTLTNPNPN